MTSGRATSRLRRSSPRCRAARSSAFTATATPEVRADIVRLLGLQAPHIHVTGFDRPNLYFEVRRGENKKAFIERYLKSHPSDAGIIYAATRKDVDALYSLLSRALAVGRYHAGLSDEERARAQDDFLYDNVQVIVATNAFRHGHRQEAGRAGRESNVRHYPLDGAARKNIEAYCATSSEQ